jgi:CDP-4-dehydro-6-deoxyglucose reductase
MSRKLSLSQAARLIGITRKQIQQKIQQGLLAVMEGYVTLEDLKKAYPNAQYEDNTMLEKMQKNMADAVHKMSESEREGAQLDALSRRAFLLSQELSNQKAKANYYEELFNRLKHKFIDISSQQTDKTQIIELQNWLAEETTDAEDVIYNSSKQLIKKQIQQFMLPHVRLLPSRHDFISDKSQTLLESALHAGLAVDYGCNNGKCGKCKMKLISGQVEKVKHADYVLSHEEKAQNTILSCSHRAVSDVVLETSEAETVEDIPLQKIATKIKDLTLKNSTYILNLKTPRSQRLRFLAGQEMKLSLDTGEHLKLSIASCPCDDMNIQFHLPNNPDNRLLQQLISDSSKIKKLTIEGPDGFYTLNEDSPRALVFIAEEIGFANIKSLIEHALALDLTENIHLYWVARHEDELYMENICRSWNDALDNFTFHKMITETDYENKYSDISNNIIDELENENSISQLDFYISGSQEILDTLSLKLKNKDCRIEQVHTKVTPSLKS